MEKEYIQQSLPLLAPSLMDMAKLEEMQMQAANFILNRTNFYNVMAQFNTIGSPPHIFLRLSPQVARDLSIYDEEALQRAIKMHLSFCSHVLTNYSPSPLLWFYSKMVLRANGGRDHFIKATKTAKIMVVLSYFAICVFCIAFTISTFTNDFFFTILGFLLLCVVAVGFWGISRIKPMEELNVSFLNQCPMIDYVVQT